MTLTIDGIRFETTVKKVIPDRGITQVEIVGIPLGKDQSVIRKVNVDVKNLFDLVRFERERREQQKSQECESIAE